MPLPINEKSVKSQETAPGERERRLSSLFVVPCHEPDLSMSFHLCFFFTYTIQTFPCPKHFPPFPCALLQKYFPSQKDFHSPFFLSLLFFGTKHFLSSITEMDHLWTFASEAETFELKDIVAALSEIQVGQHQPKLPTLPCGRKIPKLNSRKF